MPIPEGVVPPLITPLTVDGEVDKDSLTGLVNLLVDSGVDGLFPLGSSGEVSFLNSAQRRDVLETVVDAARGRVPVLAGAIDSSRNRVLENAQMAADVGADFVVVTAPFYAKVNAEDIEAHFRSVAADSPLPVVAYDIPVNVGHKLDSEMLVRLGMDGQIVAVKDSSGQAFPFRLLAMRNKEAGSPLTLLTGTEVVVDADILLGADGVVPGLANVAPKDYVRLFQLASEGLWDEARILQERLINLFQIVEADPDLTGPAQAIGAFKEAMVIQGFIANASTSSPSRPLSAEAKEKISDIVTAHLDQD